MTATLDRVLPDIVSLAEVSAEGDSADMDAQRRKLFVRSIAGAIAGGLDPLVSGLALDGGRGTCELLTGHAAVASPASAAGVHAAAITVSQCDDGLREAAGHPGLHAFSAAWSVGLSRGVSYERVLTAFAAGWEVGAQLGLVLGRPRAGIHPHGGWGTAAAAVATAVILGADQNGLHAAARAALSVALTGPDSATAAGAAAHHLLPGLGTANGVTVALLGLALSDTPSNALSHFASVSHPQAVSQLDSAGGALMLSAYVKPIGLCAHTLTAWHAAAELRRTAPDARIISIEVRTYAAAALLDDPAGGTVLARRFSIPWAVAYGLTDSRPGPSDRHLAALAASVSVVHDPELDHLYPQARPTRVAFHCADGRTIETAVDVHPGDREMPLSDSTERDVCEALLREGGQPHAAETLRALLVTSPDTPIRSVAAQLSQHENRNFTHVEGNQ